MVHKEAIHFCRFVRNILPSYFKNKKVLDVGGGDINGNNRYLFTDCEYVSNDVIEAPNVTIVSRTKDLQFEDETFDVIISTECFEHDPEYKESLLNMYRMLKKDGLLFFTCASEGRAEHGTRKTSPNDSYGTIGNVDDMSDYYKNLIDDDIYEVYDMKNLFSAYELYINILSNDLYFIAIKNGTKKIVLDEYSATGAYKFSDFVEDE